MGTNYYLVGSQEEEATRARCDVQDVLALMRSAYRHGESVGRGEVIGGYAVGDFDDECADLIAEARKTYQSRLHIGKSAADWCFMLRVYPGIQSLEDWQRAWSQPNVGIEDEYGNAVSVAEMLDTITDRYGSDQSVYARSVRGPRGLLRSAPSENTKYPEDPNATYDLISDDFS
jgi:hypothetical protein